MASADELWLETLQRLTSRVAHEVKGALNGVALNLEVIRSRALRDEVGAASLQRFADSASEQHEVVIRIAEALLALGRKGREPIDVGLAAKHLVAMLSPVARANGWTLECAVEGNAATVTSAPDSAVRLALATVLLAVSERKTDTRCVCVAQGIASPVVRIAPAIPAEAISADVNAVLKAAGITHHTDGHGSFMVFPVT